MSNEHLVLGGISHYSFLHQQVVKAKEANMSLQHWALCKELGAPVTSLVTLRGNWLVLHARADRQPFEATRHHVVGVCISLAGKPSELPT